MESADKSVITDSFNINDILNMYEFPVHADISKSNHLLRHAILYAFDNKCFYTGEKLTIENLSIDHVIPSSKDGPDNYYNYVPTTKNGNSKKNDKVNMRAIVGTLSFIHTAHVKKIEEYLNKNNNYEKLLKKAGTIIYFYGEYADHEYDIFDDEGTFYHEGRETIRANLNHGFSLVKYVIDDIAKRIEDPLTMSENKWYFIRVMNELDSLLEDRDYHEVYETIIYDVFGMTRNELLFTINAFRQKYFKTEIIDYRDVNYSPELVIETYIATELPYYRQEAVKVAIEMLGLFLKNEPEQWLEENMYYLKVIKENCLTLE